MDHMAILGRASRPIRAALVGVGEFGASFLFRSGRARGLDVVAAVDADVARVVAAAVRAGFAPDRIALCANAPAALAALTRGEFVAAEDPSILVGLPVDFVVEATGAPESAARVAAMAIAHGKHVGLVTKECDSVVGAALQARANAAHVVCTPVDGDQPSLLISLVSWARLLGLEVSCAGKAGEYDFVYDAAGRTVSVLGTSVVADWMDSGWSVSPHELARCVVERGRRLDAWPHRTVPDLCELAIVANATGLEPDRPQLHAPIARPLELPEIMRPRSEGGLFDREGVVDMFNCLRRSDESSFAGGVFVIVRCDDAATWKVLRGKGIPTSDDGERALLHNPVHLLGIEAPMTLFQAAAWSKPVGRMRPVCDLHARATRPLAAGTRLTLGARHAIDGVEPMLAGAAAATSSAPVPYYMAAGCALRTAVAEGDMLRREHLVPPEDSMLWRLRDEQDAAHFHRCNG